MHHRQLGKIRETSGRTSGAETPRNNRQCCSLVFCKRINTEVSHGRRRSKPGQQQKYSISSVDESDSTLYFRCDAAPRLLETSFGACMTKNPTGSHPAILRSVTAPACAKTSRRVPSEVAADTLPTYTVRPAMWNLDRWSIAALASEHRVPPRPRHRSLAAMMALMLRLPRSIELTGAYQTPN